MLNYILENNVELNDIETIHFDKEAKQICLGYQYNNKTCFINIDLLQFLELTKLGLRMEAKDILINDIKTL
jgi:hypothetical protein